MNNRLGNWMQTWRGTAYWPLDPRAHEIHIEDIAHSLSNLCRYNGHCDRFYSVAEHSVYVSHVVPPEYALYGLLHDATEAYCADVPRPLKHMLADYGPIEHRNWLAVCERFELDPEMPQCVKDADNAVLLAEKIALMGPSPMPWSVPGTAAKVVIQCLLPLAARDFFLNRYRTLTNAPGWPD
jgi:uncharacterized protein